MLASSGCKTLVCEARGPYHNSEVESSAITTFNDYMGMKEFEIEHRISTDRQFALNRNR
jgi:hypothetical protein